MALMRLTFFSEVLGKYTYVNIILPQNVSNGWWGENAGRPPFPVLYLLHGLSDDQDAWLRNTAIERYAGKHNLAIVMPTTERGFYTDTTYGIKHFSYISGELPQILRQYLPLSDRREDNYAAGLSMGGYGALKLALRNPRHFSFAASLSGAPMSREMMTGWEREHDTESDFAKEMRSVFGETVKPEDDVFRLLESAAPKPSLFICCGKKDGLFPINEALNGYANKLEYDVTWRADEGYDHEWAYWDLMLQEVLKQLPEQTKPLQGV